ncbi:hypothetical protein EJ110_NYTH10664 [Nymphaea thermarum]|nr:hypothetical protein EJ110_NYTH10664 [Nymphaea thermarum]
MAIRNGSLDIPSPKSLALKVGGKRKGKADRGADWRTTNMGMVKMAARDAAMTFLWVGCASTLRPLTANLFSYLQPRPPLALLLRTTIVFLLRYIFISIGKFLGGASFNPAITTTFYAAGLGRGSLFSLAIRFPAQAVGAMGGALAVKELMPMPHKNLLGGPLIKVNLHTGAIAEGILTFCFNLALLFVIIRGPSSTILKVWLLSMVTVSLRMAGSSYTGPSMNPANVKLETLPLLCLACCSSVFLEGFKICLVSIPRPSAVGMGHHPGSVSTTACLCLFQPPHVPNRPNPRFCSGVRRLACALYSYLT